VVPLESRDWWPILRGGSFESYLGRAAALVDRLHVAQGPLALVGHSAGGWVARILLGGEPYQGGRLPSVLQWRFWSAGWLGGWQVGVPACMPKPACQCLLANASQC
jgi:pimeloyl-ACP methyl ester carboxylesterase